MAELSTTDRGAPPDRESAGGKAVWFVLLGLVVLVGGLWVAAYAVAGDDVPRGTTISGVDVGGRPPEDAVRALRAGLSERVGRPVTVTVGGSTQRVGAEEAGLAVDHEASVEEAGGGRSWHPADLWDHYTAGEDLDAVLDVDDEAFDALLDRLEQEAGTPARDGDLTFRRGRVQVVEPRTGQGLDPDQALDALSAALLDDAADRTAELDLVEVQPEIGQDAVDRALEEFGEPAVSAPVSLVFGDSPVRLTPRQYAPALGVRAEDGELVPDLDEEVLTALVDEAVGEAGAPVDATVELRDGRPRVVPAKPGVTYEPDDVTEAFLTLVTAPEGERTMEVEATVAEPEFTTAEARELGIKEEVSSFTTYYPPAAYRDTNIGRAAEIIDGTVLKPGETFSLNDTVGERTRENGFTEGFIISNGIFKEDLGGGVSQMATTLFNAAFFAGLEDVEHKPHSFYIDRYPVGREATVAWGAVDLRFRNDTPYGILIDTSFVPSAGRSQGEVTVTMWSTKYWDITSTTSERYNFTAPATRRLDTPDCYPNEGYSGFDVDVTRIFRRHGESEVVRRERFHTTYTPSDTVVCVPPGGGRD